MTKKTPLKKVRLRKIKASPVKRLAIGTTKLVDEAEEFARDVHVMEEYAIADSGKDKEKKSLAADRRKIFFSSVKEEFDKEFDGAILGISAMTGFFVALGFQNVEIGLILGTGIGLALHAVRAQEKLDAIENYLEETRDLNE